MEIWGITVKFLASGSIYRAIWEIAGGTPFLPKSRSDAEVHVSALTFRESPVHLSLVMASTWRTAACQSQLQVRIILVGRSDMAKLVQDFCEQVV
jgi:hypothetical protein